MTKYKRFTRLQKEGILSEAMRGDKSIAEVCRQHGISRETFYNWKAEILQGVDLVPSNEDYEKMIRKPLPTIPRLTRKEEIVLDQAVERIARVIAKQVEDILRRSKRKGKKK